MKTMTNVKVQKLSPNEVIYEMPHTGGLQYVHPGKFGLLQRLELEIGRTYTVEQVIVGKMGWHDIFEWIAVADQNPRPEIVIPQRTKLLEF